MKDLNIDIYILILYTRFTTCVRFGGKSMKKLPQISEAEFEVMRVIWEHAPISTKDNPVESKNNSNHVKTPCYKGRNLI